MENSRPKVAVNVFVIRGEKLLLGKRKGKSGDGDWGLPGGHLEFSEHLSDCAKRELAEETGLETSYLRFLQLINDPTREDNTHYLHINFVTENIFGEPQLMEPDKCYEWKWFDFTDLPKNIFLGHRASISTFFKKISFVS